MSEKTANPSESQSQPQPQPQQPQSPSQLRPHSETISINVVDQNGSQVIFKIKETTPLGKLTSTYCERFRIDPKSIRFLYEGQRIDEKSTPKSLGMTQGDTIDAVLQQTGG